MARECTYVFMFIVLTIAGSAKLSLAQPITRCEELDGWQDEGSSKCFFAPNEEPKAWIEAERSCNAYGGHLASIQSERESQIVRAVYLFENGAGQGTWIGLSDAFVDTTEGNFMWSDGSAVSFTSWDASQPDDHLDAQDCVEMVSFDGKWDDAGCSEQKHFICVVDTSCEDQGGINGNGKCFFRPKAKATWGIAAEVCNVYGAHLVSIASEEEQDIVFSLRQEYSKRPNDMWIGLSNAGTNTVSNAAERSEWRWSDGSVDSFREWDALSNTDDGAQCVVFEGTNGTWATRSCDELEAFVCSRRKPAAPQWLQASEAYVPCGADTLTFVKTTVSASSKREERSEFSYVDNYIDESDVTEYYEDNRPNRVRFDKVPWSAPANGCFDSFWLEFIEDGNVLTFFEPGM